MTFSEYIIVIYVRVIFTGEKHDFSVLGYSFILYKLQLKRWPQLLHVLVFSSGLTRLLLQLI